VVCIRPLALAGGLSGPHPPIHPQRCPGVGTGFGLQKVISNLISGVILLLDKSIKPGDVIGVAGTYGWIRSLGARYALVVTRDGIEHLIPNEELITTRVENWSHSDQRVRLKIPIGVSYNTDLRRAMALCVEAAEAVDRAIEDPAPLCLGDRLRRQLGRPRGPPLDRRCQQRCQQCEKRHHVERLGPVP